MYKLPKIFRPKGSKCIYSQCGEDLIIRRFFKNRKNGFYVDIGANQPRKLNNTYLYYQQGWSGVNVEPHPECYQKLKRVRPRDINLNIGISKNEGGLSFYTFKQTVRSTFSKETAEDYKNTYDYTGKITIKTLTLQKVLETHAADKDIDILSVDTEGTDLEVLKSNDWETFRPKFIILETSSKKDGYQIKDGLESTQYLEEKDYLVFADTFINTIYLDKNCMEDLKLRLSND